MKFGLFVCSLFVMLAGTASATPKEAKAYEFWPKVSGWESDGNTFYGVPTVDVILYQVVDGKRVGVELSEDTAEYLQGVFEEAEEGDIWVSLEDGTIHVLVGATVGSEAMEEYVDYYIEKTFSCLRALKNIEDAEAVGEMYLDFDLDTLLEDLLMEVVEENQPRIAEMVEAFNDDRCLEERNHYEPDQFVERQVEKAVRGMLLGIEDAVHFSEADLVIATRVLDELYLGVKGFFPVRSAIRVKEAMAVSMELLSPKVTEYDERSYFNYFDFVYYASDFSVHDLLQIACNCVSCGAGVGDSCKVCDGHFSSRVSLEECYQEGKLVFDTVKLSDEVRGFVRGGGERD
jgi:hypothetical protein